MIHRIYALHLGDKLTTRGEFLFRERSNDPLTISFYLWAVLGGPEPILYDVGFNADHARERSLHVYHERDALLAGVGLAAPDVRTIVMSHLHWDHWSGYEYFSDATFLVQESEVAFWEGPSARHALIASSANLRALAAVEGLRAMDRLRPLPAREHDLWPGLRIVPLSGHTPGLQALLVETERGPVMLASDALHYYENYTKRRPAQVTMDFPGALDAFDRIAALVGDDVIGGHDPSDTTRFERVAEGVYRIA